MRKQTKEVLLSVDFVILREGQSHWKWYKMEEAKVAQNSGRYEDWANIHHFKDPYTIHSDTMMNTHALIHTYT